VKKESCIVNRFRSKVISIKDLTHDTKEITFKLIEPAEISFKPGHYAQLITPHYANVKQSVSRAYSISSSPDHKDFIELIIRKVPEGICTTWVHEYLKVGDIVEFTAPLGDFQIQNTNADMLFVAGGSGKAPIKSMMEFLAKRKSTRRMGYFYGARKKNELYYTDLFKNFEKEMYDFTYYPVLSQLSDDCEWDGRCGYVMPFFAEFIKDPANTEAYLCGSPGMIAAIVRDLTNRGIPECKIFYDSYA